MVNLEKKPTRQVAIMFVPLIFLTQVSNPKSCQMSPCCGDCVSTPLSAFVTYFRYLPCILSLSFSSPRCRGHQGVQKVPQHTAQNLGQSARTCTVKTKQKCLWDKNQWYVDNPEDRTVFVYKVDHRVISQEKKNKRKKSKRNEGLLLYILPENGNSTYRCPT